MLSLWHKIIWKFDVILNVSLFGSLSHTHKKEDSINLSACVFDVKKLNMHRFGRHTSPEWSHLRTTGGIFQDPYSPNGNRNQKSLTPANHNCWLKQISIMFEINWKKFNKKNFNILEFVEIHVNMFDVLSTNRLIKPHTLDLLEFWKCRSLSNFKYGVFDATVQMGN